MDDLKTKVYYTIPMPPSSTPQETAGVSPFVHHGKRRGEGNREEGLTPLFLTASPLLDNSATIQLR